MTTPDLIGSSVRRVFVRITADDRKSAGDCSSAVRAAITRVLDDAAHDLGDEVVVIRHMDVALDATAAFAANSHELEHALRKPILARLLDARGRSADRAYFSSRSAAVAAYLAALASGGAVSWEFAVLGLSGRSWDDTLRSCANEGAAFLGDTLAALSSLVSPTKIASLTSPELAARGVAIWSTLDADALQPDRLPWEVRKAVLDAASPARGGASPHARALSALAVLFAKWPPARGLKIDPQALVVEAASAVPIRRSLAGGLVVWTRLFAREGLDDILSLPGTAERTRRAIRWAVGRALEDPALDPNDPMLAWWSGEAVDARLSPDPLLATVDGDALHERALVRACERFGASGIRIISFGTGVAALSGGLVIDSILDSSDPHALVERVAHRMARIGRPPGNIEVPHAAESEDIGTVADVDFPRAPDGLRPALRTFCSLARRVLLERASVHVRDLHKLPATLVGDGVVELRRNDLVKLPPELHFADGEHVDGARTFRVRLT
jgi:hypothetical protein